MATFYLDNQYANFKGHWTAATAITLGWRMMAKSTNTGTARKYVFECTTAGTTHATTEPTWDVTPGNTTADNNVVWTCREATQWTDAHGRIDWLTLRTTSGDVIKIHKTHDETRTAVFSILGGAANNPLKIYCVDKDNSDALSVGAVVKTTAGDASMFFKSCGYSYGVLYSCTYGVIFFSAGESESIGTVWILEGDASASPKTKLLRVADNLYNITIGSAYEGKPCSLTVLNGSIELAHSGAYIRLFPSGRFIWKGGSFLNAANTGCVKLFDGGSYGQRGPAFIQDVDLTAVGNGANARSLIDVGDNLHNDIIFSRCKLPTDAGFTPVVGTWPLCKMGGVRLHHCSGANNTYDFSENSYEGTVQDETTIVKTGGASDGTTPQSWKLASNGVPDQNNHFALESPPIAGWTTSTSAKTFTIECVYDSATNLQNDEVWMELEYPANATDGLGAVASDKCAQLGTPVDKTASTVGWTTTGITNVNKFKCSVTATPGKVGPIAARVYVAKASTTVYVDPMITES